MSAIKVLRIKAELNGNPDAAELASAIILFAKRQGGEGVAFEADGAAAVAVRGLTPALLESLIQGITETFLNRGQAIEIRQCEAGGITDDIFSREPARGQVLHQRLTRSFFFSLPDGAFVISGVSDDTGAPLFAEQVGPLRARSLAWTKAVSVGAAQRMCSVCWSEDDFRAVITKRTIL